MSAKCFKILVLVSLIPLALTATSLLLGHGVPSSFHQSWSTGTTAVSISGPVHKRHRQTTPRRRVEGTLAAFDSRRPRQVDGEGWFEDDKRLAPTGSNPLHNLR
ncbi:uncharacterized protein LOC133886653 [Phragmites australis]|uniref:uncharacterized protein LOC133886653 n=1 Tax=Phragmites australis TaxID=29695 RepID=UPI002D789153|nr:uncharacterized protein LOC133886653 [Phragmites australis]